MADEDQGIGRFARTKSSPCSLSLFIFVFTMHLRDHHPLFFLLYLFTSPLEGRACWSLLRPSSGQRSFTSAHLSFRIFHLFPEGAGKWSFIARIEGPQFHRGASASKRTIWPLLLFPPPLNIHLPPSYNVASLEPVQHCPSTAADDDQASILFSATKNPQRIPANTPPVFRSLRPHICLVLLRLVTNGNIGKTPANPLAIWTFQTAGAIEEPPS